MAVVAMVMLMMMIKVVVMMAMVVVVVMMHVTFGHSYRVNPLEEIIWIRHSRLLNTNHILIETPDVFCFLGRHSRLWR
jgi:hypothetical protein